ncbi:GGDEF domain-containing protein [Nocardia brasiliensis]|uniref:GGDEF domain-containing protein n=1 Tax=Nocardia brasiliensis TaxID=37326 RepID=UPI00245432C0|nr:GGDEF domain-containing protein [Nocardia brasiliensis]
MAEGRSLVQSWWHDRAGYDWLTDVLGIHSALRYVRTMIGAGGAVMCLVTAVSLISNIGPRNTWFAIGCWLIVGLTALWALRWWLLPWPSRVEALLWCAGADLAITFGALAAEHRVYGALVSTLMVVVGMFVIFQGPLILALHICWSLLSGLVLVVLLVIDDPVHTGGAAGDVRLAIAIMLILSALNVVGLPTVQFCHWLWRQHALLDPLTMLLNRRGLDYHLSYVFRPETAEYAYMAALDLDRFKTVNDTFGHSFGDEVLVRTAERLRSTADPDAIVARTGGEEFVVLGRLRDEPLAAVAERLRGAIETMPGLPVTVTASVGAALCPITALRDPAVARYTLHRCDFAMYEAKRLGGNLVALEGPESADSVAADERNPLCRRATSLS